MKFIETEDSQIINVSNVILFEKICNEGDVVPNYMITALFINEKSTILGNYKTRDEMNNAYINLKSFLRSTSPWYSMK